MHPAKVTMDRTSQTLIAVLLKYDLIFICKKPAGRFVRLACCDYMVMVAVLLKSALVILKAWVEDLSLA